MVKKRSSDRKKIHNDTNNVANNSSKQKKKWNNDNNNFPDFSSFTVNQLKEELKSRGLQTNGKKITLLNRLIEVMTSNGDAVKRRAGSPRNESANYERLKNGKDFSTKLTDETKDIVLWKKPLITLSYFFKELTIVLSTFFKRLWVHRRMVTFVFLVTLMLFVSSRISGPHQELLLWMYKRNMWCLYWLGLGVLSSVGLGTGLHTFLLYLGPHIATVTLAACECGALNFPEPPYPDQIVCPDAIDPAWSTSLWNIMKKVKLEAVMWGAGTALGELPPYFMARAARLSGSEDDELREFEELQRKKENPDTMTVIDKAKLFVEKLVNKVGFFGILACASIPNPLFDLAGITCGHFLIPFWTFFGATLIGKAVIKMMIQVLFVIIAFDEMLIEKALRVVSIIPIIGVYLQTPLNQFLENQKQKLHTRKGNVQQNSNMLSVVFEVLVITMVTYFLISIINSMAQNYHRKLNKDKKRKVTSS